MNKPEQFLKELTEYGFDWFEEVNYEKFFFQDARCDKFWFVHKSEDFKSNKEITYSKIYSLADLTCNKSFLEAMAKMEAYGMFGKAHKIQNMDSFIREIQPPLIEHLVEKGNSGFWELCYQLTGWKQ